MLELNAELSLSENIKTPISKNLVSGKAWCSINIRHFNAYQFACLHRHVCSVEVSVSLQRPGVKVGYCPQLFSTLFFEARSLSVAGVSLAIYSRGDPHSCLLRVVIPGATMSTLFSHGFWGP